MSAGWQLVTTVAVAAAALTAVPPGAPTGRLRGIRALPARPSGPDPPRGIARRLLPGGLLPGGMAAGHLCRRARDPARRGSVEAGVAGLAERLAALSRAGLPAARSWELLAASGDTTVPADVVHRVTAMLRAGGGAAAGLRAAAAASGPALPALPAGLRRQLLWLAVAWEVSERSGAPLAGVLDRLAATARAEAAVEDARRAALAGPRATAAILSALPAAGVLLGQVLGARPLAMLLGSPPGRLCLAVGLGAWLAGRWWTGRLVAAATAPVPRRRGSVR